MFSPARCVPIVQVGPSIVAHTRDAPAAAQDMPAACCRGCVGPLQTRLPCCSLMQVWLAEYCGALVAVKILAKVWRRGGAGAPRMPIPRSRARMPAQERSRMPPTEHAACAGATAPFPREHVPKLPSQPAPLPWAGQVGLHDAQHAAAAGAAQPAEGGAAHVQAAPPQRYAGAEPHGAPSGPQPDLLSGRAAVGHGRRLTCLPACALTAGPALPPCHRPPQSACTSGL